MYNHEPQDYKCDLCVFAKGGETELNKKGDIVFEDADVIAYTSPKWWVNNPGNIMVIPKKHFENVYDIPDDILGKIQVLGKKIALGIKATYKSDGVSFRQHNEPSGDQGVWHYHLHVFPRWKNDDLYLKHEDARYVSADERAPYAKLLREYFKK